MLEMKAVNEDAQRVLQSLTRGLEGDRYQKIVGGDSWNLAVTVKRLGTRVFTLAHYYEIAAEEFANPEFSFMVDDEGQFLPYWYRSDRDLTEDASAEVTFDEDGLPRLDLLNAELQREHVKLAEEWLQTIRYQVVTQSDPPKILARMSPGAYDSYSPLERSDTQLRARVSASFTGGAEGKVAVECFESKDEASRGGVVLRFSLNDDGRAITPFAIIHERGVDLHLCGEAEAEAMLDVLRVLLRHVELRREGTTNGTRTEIFKGTRIAA